MLAKIGRGLIAAGVVATALGSGTAFADQTLRVEMADFVFRPNAFSARVGEKITFQAPNVGQRPHDIKIEGPGGFSWEMVPGAGNVAAGQSGSGEVTFTAPGTYELYCPVGNHRAQGMTATFTVTAAAGAATTAAPAASAAPAAAAAPAASLPRTGDPAGLLGGALAAAGALLAAGGVYLRRR